VVVNIALSRCKVGNAVLSARLKMYNDSPYRRIETTLHINYFADNYVEGMC
jgi:hypothetical protein